MLERQIHKETAVYVEDIIQSARDRLTGNGQCKMIGCKGQRRPAKHVAWELVKYDHGRHRSVSRAGRSCGMKICHYLLMDCKKTRANSLVDGRIWLEPCSGPDLIKPKMFNDLDPRRPGYGF